MNTLSKTITGAWFTSPDGFNDLEGRWSQIVNSPLRKQLTATDHLIYAVLRGKDWRKGLSPISDRKFANGGWCCSGLLLAYSNFTEQAWTAFLARTGNGIVDAHALPAVLTTIRQCSKQNVLPESAYNLLAPAPAGREVTHV